VSCGQPLVCSISLSISNEPGTTEVYTLSLHDALPICVSTSRSSSGSCPSATSSGITSRRSVSELPGSRGAGLPVALQPNSPDVRSEEHTSELQSRENLVCRLLLEKKQNYSKHRYVNLI